MDSRSHNEDRVREAARLGPGRPRHGRPVACHPTASVTASPARCRTGPGLTDPVGGRVSPIVEPVWSARVSSIMQNEPNFGGDRDDVKLFFKSSLGEQGPINRSKRRTQFRRAGGRRTDGERQRTDNGGRRAFHVIRTTHHAIRNTGDGTRQTKPIGVAVLSTAERIWAGFRAENAGAERKQTQYAGRAYRMRTYSVAAD